MNTDQERWEIAVKYARQRRAEGARPTEVVETLTLGGWDPDDAQRIVMEAYGLKPPPAVPPAAHTQPTSSVLPVAAFVFGVLSIGLFIFGPLAIGLGIYSARRSQLKVLAIVAAVLGLIGMVLPFLVVAVAVATGVLRP